MENGSRAAGLLSLPEKYDEMQEVDNVDWNKFPDGLKHHPFIYVVQSSFEGRSALTALSVHGFGAFYKEVFKPQAPPFPVGYEQEAAPYDKGCMVQAHREIAQIPDVISVAVTATDGEKSVEEVKTIHADDVSKPPLAPYYQVPTPICHVEMNAGKVILHCMAYLEDSRYEVDVKAVGKMKFEKHTDGQGDLIDWRIEVPLIANDHAPVLQYFSLEVVGNGTIKAGEVVRLKLASITGEGQAGRSFAFVWP